MAARAHAAPPDAGVECHCSSTCLTVDTHRHRMRVTAKIRGPIGVACRSHVFPDCLHGKMWSERDARSQSVGRVGSITVPVSVFGTVIDSSSENKDPKVAALTMLEMVLSPCLGAKGDLKLVDFQTFVKIGEQPSSPATDGVWRKSLYQQTISKDRNQFSIRHWSYKTQELR